MITIIDYGTGNISSIKNMLKKAGYRDAVISGKVEDVERSEKLILPGVGHFDHGMEQLKKSGLIEVLNKRVLEDKIPVLGICLGAQLLTKGSEEGKQPGLGWINAHTVKFDRSKMDERLKVPHMGWTEVELKKESPLFKNMHPEPRFYFVHAYHIVCDDPSDVVVTGTYGYEFVAGVERGNIMGMQFHPEKSHKFGMKLLENFVAES